MRRRMKKTTKQYIMVAIICIIVIGGAATATTYVMTDSVKDTYQGRLDAAYAEMVENTRSVYVAQTDIMPGDPITEENVMKYSVYSQQPQDSFITEEDIGKVALIKLPAGTQVMKSMLSDNQFEEEVREVQYDVILANSNIISDDTVDVRIVYPNGENYVVLSKKVLKNYTQGETSCYFWLNEEEILRMSAAIVDASLYPGTTLVTVKYIEPSIQKASEVTYTPSLSTLSLLETDPNILERSSQDLAKKVRKALENRLALSSNLDATQTQWDVDNDTYINQTQNEVPTPAPITPSPVPTQAPAEVETGGLDDDNTGDLGAVEDGIMELGSCDDYLYYAKSQNVPEGAVELGE